MARYVFITGGVVSSLGKGLASAALGAVLQARGYKVRMRKLDPYAVTVEAPVGVTGEQLIARVEEAGRRGTMVNFTFHGIGGDYLSVSKQAHEELLQYLSAHRDLYWVDTFINLMKYVRRQQSPAGQ